MRILFWSETFWPRVGGVENLAAKLIPELQVRGHEFTVVTWDHRIEKPDKIRFERVPVYRFPFFSRDGGDALGPIMKIREIIHKLKQEFRPDLVHVNCFGRSIFFHLATVKAHLAPVLLTLHQALPDEEIDPESILGKLLSTADWVTACSDAVLCHAAELAPKIRSRSSTIHNALERPKVDRRPLPFDPPQLLFLGRLVPEKGLDWALAAFPSIFHRFPSARLIVAGEGPDMEELKAKADSLGLARWVEFIGGVPPQSVPHLINHATVVVMPSRVEGFGLVALEAAMMGRPVVGVQVGGLPEVVSDGKTGFLVKSCDTDAFVKAVLRLLGDPDTAKQFGDAACKRAQEMFDWKRYVESYDALYRQLAT